MGCDSAPAAAEGEFVTLAVRRASQNRASRRPSLSLAMEDVMRLPEKFAPAVEHIIFAAALLPTLVVLAAAALSLWAA